MATGTSSGEVRGTAARNVDGRAIAITVFSTVKPWGRVWLPVLFTLPHVAPRVLDELRRLSFIHFARWTLVRRIPWNGPPQQPVTLHHPHLFFESNFNGGWEEYIDAFSYVLTRGMRLFWGSSYGFPGSLPTVPFKKYIRDNEIEASHYYSAYPDATASMVLAALQLEPAVQDLVRRARTSSPDEFSQQWQVFLTRAQRWL
ncbi:hypothetical protein CLV35_1898 [Motilibacter peucedani]|uniref:Uncharacterized protein n=1 Tax=Motilibacter peucedani TaxID=598650 RepID=A0A420XQD3_9ACTN|nr:hypothetical protein [Motilibacter peucedani]RKS75432.1 hypothetical protein CLV35_1898 [Motilibacter peucedani]